MKKRKNRHNVEWSLSEAFPLRTKNYSEPYFVYSILFTKQIKFKIGYIPSPNCSFVKIPKKLETMYYLLVPFRTLFGWMLLPTFCRRPLLSDVVIGILKEWMDLVNYVLILGKSYLLSCRRKDIKPSISHFGRILDNKYETEKYIAFKSNRIISISG